jgi:tRNA nucleotidyltransferase (CCA-adding enzyme)
MREAGAFEGCSAARVHFVAFVWRLPEEAITQVGVRLMVPPMLVQFAVRCRAVAAAWQPRASPSHVSRVLRALPPEGPAAVRALLRAGGSEWDAAVARYVTVWRHARPLVTGHDLRQAGMVPGPRFAVLLASLLDAVIDGVLPASKEAQLSWCLAQK